MYALRFGFFPSRAKCDQERKEVVFRWMITLCVRRYGTVIYDFVYPALIDGVIGPLGELCHPRVGWGIYGTAI